MFAPTKTWRRWHKKINVNQRRYAVASALAASAVPSLVMARGHKIDNVPEVPLVVSDAFAAVDKTKKAMAILEKFGAVEDVLKAKNSRNIRRGKGKMRNRRYTARRGPLIVYSDETEGVKRAFKNLSGVELVHVNRLNLLQLAPGGHVGRFCIWMESAFKQLDNLFGTYTKKSALKSGFQLPRHSVHSGDIARVINSDEIQSAVNPAKQPVRRNKLKKNPLKNKGVMAKLNPYSVTMRRTELLNAGKRKAKAAVDKATKKARKAASKAFYEKMMLGGPAEEESSEEEEEEEEEEE